jgi:hypothetical protein
LFGYYSLIFAVTRQEQGTYILAPVVKTCIALFFSQSRFKIPPSAQSADKRALLQRYAFLGYNIAAVVYYVQKPYIGQVHLKRGADMTTLLIIAAITAAIYGYGAIAFYYGSKNWNPLCGCRGTKCSSKRTTQV